MKPVQTIEIPQEVIDFLIRQACDELPDEACGLLTGVHGPDHTVVVHKCYPMENTDHSPEHFSFDPREQFRVLKEARADGLRIIANYHSHPSTPARPSEEDIRLAFDPEILYLILSLASESPVIKAFAKTEQGMIPVVLKTFDASSRLP